MTELTFAILKYAFLALLWVFVLLAVRALYRDVSDLSPHTSRRARRKAQEKAQTAIAAAKAAPPVTVKRQTPEANLPPSGRTQAKILVIIDGPLAGTTMPLDVLSPVTLGRSASNTVVLDDEFISSLHARVFFNKPTSQWAVEDMNSTNGTLVNGQRITGATVLPERVPVRIGATTFELR